MPRQREESGGVGSPGARTPIRVLFLHPSDELYGADRVLLNLVRGLDRARFEPCVAVGNDLLYEGLLSRELRASGIRVWQLPLAVARRKYLSPTGIGGFLWRLAASVRRVGRLIEAERIDLVYSNTLAVWTGALAAALTRRPHVWHVHEIIERPTFLRGLMRRFAPALSQGVICVSRTTRDALLIATRARAKGMVLYNGIAPEEWMEATGRERVRAELGCSDADMLIGMVGRLSDFKAPDVFVEAASDLLGRHGNLRFFLAGDVVPGQRRWWTHVQRLIEVSPDPGRIHSLGFREDVADLTAALDILVVPSRGAETSSLVSVQAMFAGKPVVATDVGAIRETVDQGKTGLIVPKEDRVALVEAISSLVSNPDLRSTMGREGRRQALEKFTLGRQVRELNDLLWQEYAAASGGPGNRQSYRPVGAGTRV